MSHQKGYDASFFFDIVPKDIHLTGLLALTCWIWLIVMEQFSSVTLPVSMTNVKVNQSKCVENTFRWNANDPTFMFQRNMKKPCLTGVTPIDIQPTCWVNICSCHQKTLASRWSATNYSFSLKLSHHSDLFAFLFTLNGGQKFKWRNQFGIIFPH